MQQTLNGHGLCYNVAGADFEHWVTSLPDSKLPLADLGAGYGFHAGAALASGRNVITLDCDARHLHLLRERFAAAHAAAFAVGAAAPLGLLIDTVAKTLPCAAVLENSSVAGILLADVLQFVPHRSVLTVLRHARAWVQSGGRVVATVTSPVGMERRLKGSHGAFLVSGRSVEETWKWVEDIVRDGDDEALVKERPWKIGFEKGTAADAGWKDVGSAGSCFSTQEMAALARMAGLDVELVQYVSPNKDPVRFSDTDESTLLVAKKP